MTGTDMCGPPPNARPPGQDCDCPPDDPGRRCPLYWEHLALTQADRIGQQAEHIRTLIRDRDAAKSDTEAALDLAEQYARRAGHDIARDDALRYVAEYWRQRGEFERTAHAYALFHWDIFCLHKALGDAGTALNRISAWELAQMLMRDITAVSPNPNGRRKPSMAFPRPDPDTLFDLPRTSS